MASLVPGYTTAEMEGDFVVFLIGMRINKPWKLHKWIPVALAMGPMIRELTRRKELGLLHFTSWIGPRGPILVQYWRSVEQLETFARDARLPHHPAWKRWNRAVGDNGDVGIWHETYLVRDGGFEALYGNMPTFGLAAAGQPAKLSRTTRTAAGRRAANAGNPEPAIGEAAAGEPAAGEPVAR
ncbi:DUF4188 domain-containing protein [Actinoplanes sp. KI2]|uniref:DUF4188 domain-containing protein n=1 Tax=Actinoplanes sp. KI2 TaxID=2983315 RepID=UPI0021D604A6|nr:DUF4188 domain-containing protein [Actinoplanes sp. KI2]MCU7724694.1 DUF4188 domain-containing protein [Actinoplanes sp. KI2]